MAVIYRGPLDDSGPTSTSYGRLADHRQPIRYFSERFGGLQAHRTLLGISLLAVLNRVQPVPQRIPKKEWEICTSCAGRC